MSLKGVLIFGVGALAGVAGAYIFAKKKYAAISEKEIEEIRSYYIEKLKEVKNDTDDVQPVVEDDQGNPVHVMDKPDIKSLTIDERKDNIKKAKDIISKAEAVIRREEDKIEVEEISKQQGYSHPNEDTLLPYVISPDEFGEYENFDTITLTYYEDGVLADEDDDPIEDIGGLVGYDSLERFGEYENDDEDVIHVRNEARRCDFEIIRDYRKYEDVIRPDRVRIN